MVCDVLLRKGKNEWNYGWARNRLSMLRPKCSFFENAVNLFHRQQNIFADLRHFAGKLRFVRNPIRTTFPSIDCIRDIQSAVVLFSLDMCRMLAVNWPAKSNCRTCLGAALSNFCEKTKIIGLWLVQIVQLRLRPSNHISKMLLSLKHTVVNSRSYNEARDLWIFWVDTQRLRISVDDLV